MASPESSILNRVLRAVFVVLCLASSGCVSRIQTQREGCERDPDGCIIDKLDVEGARAIPAAEVADRIATAESSHILGGAFEHIPLLELFDQLTVEYERLDRSVFERDLARIERFYRARGFFEARVRAGRIRPRPDGKVWIEIVVEEGRPALIGNVSLTWKDWKPTDDTREVTRAVTEIRAEMVPGQRFDEQRYDDLQKKLLRAMTDLGFAYAKVTGHVDVDMARATADVSFTLELGPPCRFGEITIFGLGEIPEAAVRSAIALQPGKAYSTASIDAAHYALSELGVFTSVEAAPVLSPDNNPVVPVRFTLAEAELRSVGVGFGIEVGSRVETHGTVSWESHNFQSGMRRLSLQARPGVVLWPNQISTPLTKPTDLLPELRTNVEFRQPGALESRTNFLLTASVLVYCPPVNCLPSLHVDGTESLLGYRQYSGRSGFERSFGRGRVALGQFINLQVYDPFSYNQNPIPEGYRRVVIPYVETTASLDLRKNALGKPDGVEPRSGFLVSASAQVSALGTARDVRLRPELRAFAPVSKRATLAFRLGGGFLVPGNYGDSLAYTGQAPNDEVASALARDLQIVRLRGLLSGGANSNRGYGFNQIGPSATTDLVYPPTAAQRQRQMLNLMVPVGGLTLWESSLELRIPLASSLGTVLFADASDVTTGTFDLRLTHPHLSVGAGARVDTPIGPLRFDVGYRVPGFQVVEGTLRACSIDCPTQITEDQVPSTLFGLPIAVALSLGEAF